MSYIPPQPIAVGVKERPNSVRIAAYLLFASAAAYLIEVGISLSTISKSMQAMKDVINQSQTNAGSTFETAAKAGLYAGIGIDVVIIALFVIMGMFVLRGSNAWRITTFVIGGLALLCSFCGLAGSGISSLGNSGNLTTEQRDEFTNAVPTWARYGQIAMTLVIAIALIVAIIMLALPASNQFFRKTPDPMMGGYGVPYPAYPAYPPMQQPPMQQPPLGQYTDGSGTTGSGMTPPA